jgi:hypothetical protein
MTNIGTQSNNVAACQLSILIVIAFLEFLVALAARFTSFEF